MLIFLPTLTSRPTVRLTPVSPHAAVLSLRHTPASLSQTPTTLPAPPAPSSASPSAGIVVVVAVVAGKFIKYNNK